MSMSLTFEGGTLLNPAAVTRCTVQGPAPAQLSTLNPEIAVLLSLAAHPAFPHFAMSGLPTLCAIIQDAVATDAQGTLNPVLAAVWAICRECVARLTFSDASSLCTALLSTLPTPDLQNKRCYKSAEPPVDSVRSMVAALACVAFVVTTPKPKAPAWQRLHISVLARLMAGLSVLSCNSVSICVAVADMLGELVSQEHRDGYAPPCVEAYGIKDEMSLLILAAGIATHIINTHREALFDSSPSAGSFASGIADTSGQGSAVCAFNQKCSSSAFGLMMADFFMDVLVPAHVYCCEAGGVRVSTETHMAVFSALITFLEAVLTHTHGIFLTSCTSNDAGSNAIICCDQVAQNPFDHANADWSGSEPLVVSAIYLGWKCMSCGYLALAVERCAAG